MSQGTTNGSASASEATRAVTTPQRSEPQSAGTYRYIDDGLRFLSGPDLRPRAMHDYRRHIGSPFIALFAGVLFDQVAMLPVAASVDATGRFAENFSDRGVRSALSAAVSLLGSPTQRAESARWLKEMHREVRGVGIGDYEGIRYSALEPESWIWIAVSTLHLFVVTFPVCTGHNPTPVEQEAIYQYSRYLMSDLNLPSSRGQLPETWPKFLEYYDNTVRTQLQSNTFARSRYAALSRMPLPTFLPRPLRYALTPCWILSRGIAGHLIKVCSAQVMHPDLPPMFGYTFDARHDREFKIVTSVIRLLWRITPPRLLMDPFTYERLQLEKRELAGDTGVEYVRRREELEGKLAKFFAFGERYRLESFAVPDSRRIGCPMR